MPWIIGIVSNIAGLKMGMAMNIISCVGMLIFCICCKKLKRRIINIFPVFDRRGFFELS